jgi:hypothetical protein
MIKNTEDWINQERVKKIMISNHEPTDFYFEDGKVVMTESYHIKRGSCCGNGCKNCPYTPVHIKGNTTIFIGNG